MIINSPSVQSPKAYDLLNLQGAQLGARLAASANATMRANLRTALQDFGNAYAIHPSETAAGLVEANLTFGFLVGDVRRYGAVGDGVTNDGPAFQLAIKVARYTDATPTLFGTGGRVYIPRPPVAGKFYLITQALDVTIKGQPNDPGITFVGDGGAIGAPYIILKHIGHGFDLTGANRVTFEDLSIGSDATTFPKTFFLLARNSSNGSAGHHTFVNVTAIGKASGAIYYNYGSEDDKVTDCVFYNSSGSAGSAVCVFTGNNRFAFSSTFQTIATGARSCIDHQVQGGEFFNSSVDAASDVFYIDQSDYVRVENCWMDGQGRSFFFLDGAFAASNWLTLRDLEGENSTPIASFGIITTVDAQTYTHWHVENCKLSSATNFIDIRPLATLDTCHFINNSEAVAKGMVFEGTIQSSYLDLGFMTATIGTSKNNVLIGDSARWTVGTRTDDFWIDQGSTNKTWTPALGAGFTVTGALTISNKKVCFYGNLCFVTATFSAVTSIVSTAGAVITGLPKTAVARVAATYVQSDTPAIAAPCAVVGNNILVGAFTAGANVDVTVTAVYPIA